MRKSFVESVLEQLIEDRVLATSDSVIAVCAGGEERDLFERLSFSDVLITNVDDRIDGEAPFAPYDWSREDAQDLSISDAAFDFSFVADGLHHCSSPHRALLEMYRVARKGVIVIESRDNLLMRLATRMGLSPEYELEAVVGNGFAWGGVDNTPIPNFIYRWTEKEFEKTINSFDPSGRHEYRFFYGLNLPFEQAKMKRRSTKLYAVRLAKPLVGAYTTVFKKQRNTLAMIALKPRIPEDVWPWLKVDAAGIEFNRAYAERRFKDAAEDDPAVRSEP